MAARVYDTLSSGIQEQTPVMRASQDRLSFLSLSAELRNRIYELALVKSELDTSEGQGRTIDVVWDGDWTCMGMNNFGREQLWIKQPPLTRINRQIRNETLPIYYGMNTFGVSSSGWIFGRLLDCLCCGAPAEAISKVLHREEDFREAGKWLHAIGSNNANLIRHFDFKVDADKSHLPIPIFSALEPHMKGISLALAMHFGRMSVELPPATNIMACEVASNWHNHDEPLTTCDDLERGWKRLPLHLSQSAIDEQSLEEAMD